MSCQERCVGYCLAKGSIYNGLCLSKIRDVKVVIPDIRSYVEEALLPGDKDRLSSFDFNLLSEIIRRIIMVPKCLSEEPLTFGNQKQIQGLKELHEDTAGIIECLIYGDLKEAEAFYESLLEPPDYNLPST